MSNDTSSRTGILDPRVPLGKVYVDLTVDEVLEACRRYIMDKNFDAKLDEVYNNDHNESWDYWSEGDIT
jgi:hypothetical protein